MMLSSSRRVAQHLRTKLGNLVRSKSSQAIFQEVQIPVPWGHVSGKWWGPINERPILTLHGWQDNCGSFNRLIPLLNEDVGYLAIDFPGHGHSSRFPSGLYYYFINYAILIRYLVNYFQWPKVSLMGHSMGGITSFVYTMLYPRNVDFLICLDGMKPMIINNNVEKVSKFIELFQKYEQLERNSGEAPSYTIEEIKEKICKPNRNSVAYEHSFHIAERNIAPSKFHEGKFFFKRDPRLKINELLNFPQEESLENAKSITCPVFVAKAIQSSYYETKENFYEVLDVVKQSSSDCQYHRIEGTHHFHLNNPEEVAILIRQFIDKHNVEDRTLGGIKEEMKLKQCFI